MMGPSTGQSAVWDAATAKLLYSNSQRDLAASVGWTVLAMSPGTTINAAFNTALNLAVGGGSAAMPISVIGHMLFDTLMIRNTDTANLREAEWRLYSQKLNNGSSAENTLDEIVNANGSFSFTPIAVSNRNSQVATPPVYLSPGAYWLVIRNTSVSQTFGIGVAVANLTPNLFQTKTLGAVLGATLDFVAATWTKSTSMPGVILRGRVFGETVVF